MAAPSKTKKVESLTKMLQKRYKGLPVPQERTVLEHLIYAGLLENAPFETADAAYAVLEHHFIDWNEIRVSTAGELADTFPMLPDPQAAGTRVRQTLQGVFEKTYMYDLEELRKKSKNIGQSVEFLESIGLCSRFMIDYTTQVAFGGHVIPLDEASLRIFRLLGMTQVNKEGTREEVPGLERAVSKKVGLTFSIQLHHFAATNYGDPESEEFRAILKAIDPESLKRDWTPPVLTLTRVSAKPSPKFPPAFVPSLPFVAHDDDEFDEEPGGTEAEFISDGSEDFLSGSRDASSSGRETTSDPAAATVKKAKKSDAGKPTPKAAPPKKETGDKKQSSEAKKSKSSPSSPSLPTSSSEKPAASLKAAKEPDKGKQQAKPKKKPK